MKPRALLVLVALLAAIAAACDDPGAAAPLAAPSPAPLQATALPLDLDTEAQLEEAIGFYLRARGEPLSTTVDPNERYGTLVEAALLPYLADQGRYEDLFLFGDMAFEAERDTTVGFGQGPRPAPNLPARPMRLHDGELGGLDSTSCRGCHFVGGPDGSGALTQVALFRGDGHNLSSATVRDAPHIMGLGYIARVAYEMSFHFINVRDSLRQNAVELGEPQSTPLTYEGISFGTLTALPDGTFDNSALRHISPDLIVRPFGHKGRFATLEELSDEALQIHHGHQTPSRLATYRDDATTFLGPGSAEDPDDDGVPYETRDGQPMLLATYMSLLPIPQLRPPQDPALLAPWGRGRALLREVGCVECHREELRFFDYEATLRMPGPDPFEFRINLLQAGLEPKPRRFDVTPSPDGSIQGGVPIFAYTDLRRHEMGPGLAEDTDEALPDGADVIPGSVWLTRSLWGLADTAPYLHDGRAPTVHDAILWHGGEAQEARDRYAALPEQDRAALRLFLMSLTREPTMLVE